jgi:hypothetical protein
MHNSSLKKFNIIFCFVPLILQADQITHGGFDATDCHVNTESQTVVQEIDPVAGKKPPVNTVVAATNMARALLNAYSAQYHARAFHSGTRTLQSIENLNKIAFGGNAIVTGVRAALNVKKVYDESQGKNQAHEGLCSLDNALALVEGFLNGFNADFFSPQDGVPWKSLGINVGVPLLLDRTQYAAGDKHIFMKTGIKILGCIAGMAILYAQDYS